MCHILLVDDNKYIIDALGMTLRMFIRDSVILKATDGSLGADIMKSFPVDLVLTDINMPVMDGYDLIAFKNRHYPDVPVLAMTADPSPEVWRKLGALGVTECLEKPFDLDSASLLILNKLSPGLPFRALNTKTPRCATA